MSFIGKWVFDSIGVEQEEKGIVCLGGEEYLSSPMPYIDTSDAEAVEDEMRERRKTIGMQVRICEDGKLLLLIPVPDGVSEKELSAAVDSGRFKLCDGMLYDREISWEERDGILYYDIGFGEDTYVRGIDENGYFCFMTMRFKKYNN